MILFPLRDLPTYTPSHSRRHWSYKVKTPHGERPRGREASEQLGGMLNIISDLLAGLVAFCEPMGVNEQGWLVKPLSKYFMGEIVTPV